MHEQLRELIRQTTELPSMPEIAFEAIRVADQAESSASTVAATLAKDPSLSARMLRLANSSFYGMSRQVTSISDAVIVLGMRTVKSLALVAASFPWLHKALNGKGISPQLLWNHSLTTAHLVRNMATHKGFADVEMPFCIGLLHDIGTVVIAVWKEESYADLLKHLQIEETTFDGIERETFGYDHAMVGAELAEVWNLPAPYASAIRWHHQPSTPETPDPIADLIHIADILVRERGITEGLFGAIYQRDEATFARVGIPEEDLQQLLEESINQAQEFEGFQSRRAA